MHDVVAVAVIQRHQNLLEGARCHRLSKVLLGNNTVKQFPALAQLGNQVYFILIFEVFKKLDHVWMVLNIKQPVAYQSLQDFYLCLEPFPILYLAFRNCLDRPGLTRFFVS